MDVTLLDVANQVTAVAKKLEEMDGRLGQMDGRLKQFDGIEGRLTTHVDEQLAAAVVELKRHARIQNEELKDHVKKAAEGYGVTLTQIEGELVDLNKKVDNGLRDHALVIKDHSKRIVELEQR